MNDRLERKRENVVKGLNNNVYVFHGFIRLSWRKINNRIMIRYSGQ